MLNSTLPISSSTFDSLHSPMGNCSNVTELLPPSITLTPLGLGSPRQWQTTSDESRHLLASIYTSPGFNLPGYPAAEPSNLTPTVPSLAGSHHVSSTWPTGVFTSRSSSPHLTIDQANSIFKLAAECQALSVKLAKQFQVLSGLEAMHHNSTQGMVHETLTLGCSAWEAAYSAILRDGVSEAEHKATSCRLHSDANTAWKEMHKVMYNHQLQYDQQLTTFLMDTKTTLNNMRGKVWAAVHALAENEGIMFHACLGLVLQVLNLLPQIPIDISFQTQILLTIAYCLESSVYRRWHPEQGGVSPLRKASYTLSKVLGRVTCQPSEGVGHSPSLATSDNSTGLGGSWGSRCQSRSHARSITPACSQGSDSVGSAAGHHLVCSHATEDSEVSSSESKLSDNEGDSAGEDDNAKEDKGGIETSSDGQVASDGEEGQEHLHIQDTLTGVSQVFSRHEDTDPESDAREKIQSIWQKQHPKSPKEDSPLKESSESSSEEEPPMDEALHDEARQKAWLLDTCFDAWHCNKIAKGVTGWATRDTMICDLPKHGKMQPNHPDPMGPPLDYMGECQVFNSIRSDIYNLCRFYTLGTTGDPPEFPTPWEPVTHSQIRDLLKSAHSIGQPYLILAHSADSVTAISMLRELHMAAFLQCLQVDL